MSKKFESVQYLKIFSLNHSNEKIFIITIVRKCLCPGYFFSFLSLERKKKERKKKATIPFFFVRVFFYSMIDLKVLLANTEDIPSLNNEGYSGHIQSEYGYGKSK